MVINAPKKLLALVSTGPWEVTGFHHITFVVGKMLHGFGKCIVSIFVLPLFNMHCNVLFPCEKLNGTEKYCQLKKKGFEGRKVLSDPRLELVLSNESLRTMIIL